jgi:hypothetical protein
MRSQEGGVWHEAEPRAVWIMRSRRPALPGILLGWLHMPPAGSAPALWQALVAQPAALGLVELVWLYDNEIKPVAEEPPVSVL